MWGWIKRKSDEATLADWAMVFFTFVLAATTIVFTVYAKRQWQEMKSGGADTKELATQAKNQADASKAIADAAKSQSENTATLAQAAKDQVVKLEAGVRETHALAEQAKISAKTAQQSVIDNQTASYRELRPYVQVTRFDYAGNIFKGEMVTGKASIINSGRTPAVNVNGCGDITIKPNTDPITDDFPCPAPNNPKHPDTGEHSQFVLGANAPGFSIDSPGTSIAIANAPQEVFRQMLSTGALRMYFYGYVNYSDITDLKTIHRTTFCGRYNVGTGLFDVCEKHNRMD